MIKACGTGGYNGPWIVLVVWLLNSMLAFSEAKNYMDEVIPRVGFLIGY
jgi:hypothetical protein